MEPKLIKINPETLLSHTYKDVIVKIYKAIPYHPITGLTKAEIDKVIQDYAELYHYLSFFQATILIHYNGKTNDKFKLMKNATDQALSVVKFQYETLSRRLTVTKDESKFWSKTI